VTKLYSVNCLRHFFLTISEDLEPRFARQCCRF